jgi:RHS repeat-associated protein
MFKKYALSLIIILITITASPAIAQSTPADELGDGDEGWCTTVVDDGPSLVCGFGSPGAACAHQISTHYPLGLVVSQGSSRTSEKTARCLSKRTAPFIPGELYIGVTGVTHKCASGTKRIGGVCTETDLTYCDEDCDQKQISKVAGNPIDIITGAKVQSVTDFASADGRFVIERKYNSLPFGEDGADYGRISTSDNLGGNWVLSNVPVLILDNTFESNGAVTFLAPEGFGRIYRAGHTNPQTYDNKRQYAGGGGLAYEVAFDDDLLYPAGKVSRKITVTKKDGTVYNFETPEFTGSPDRGTKAKLLSTDFPGGYSHIYDYTDDDRIDTITDSFGRVAQFNYVVVSWTRTNSETGEEEVVRIDDSIDGPVRPDENATIKSIDFPDGSHVIYGYDAVEAFEGDWGVPQRLTSATRYNADGSLDSSETYHYEDKRFKFALTGITDQENIRYATWSYDGYGRADSSSHPDNVNLTTIDYNGFVSSLSAPRSRTVTNALGRVFEYDIASRFQNLTIFKETEHSSADAVGSEKTTSYDDQMPSTVVDDEGRVFAYEYDIKGRPLSITRAVGLPEESVTTAQWHPIYRIPIQVVEPGLTTDIVIDDDTGHVLSMTQTDTSTQASAPRTWAFTYDGPNLTSVDGPLSGSGDTQSFVYDGANLTSFTNEVGHTTTITEHSPIGAPSLFTDANGITTRLVYDGDNRLKDIIEDEGGVNATTTITYNKTDQILSVTPPNVAALTFVYDDARRLETITNAVGETISYTRNPMGGITDTHMSDDAGTITYQLTQVFDQKNRVMSAIGAGATGSGTDAVTEFGYDREDNLTSITDPRNKTWSQAFDGLDRLKSETDPLNATTDYGLSPQTGAQNPLTSVTDARGATTNYIRNGYGEVVREVSFEAGTTEYVRETRGLITQMKDARNIVSNYTYDDMGRLLTVSYPSESSSNITYGYDAGPNGKGQLTSVTEDYGVTTYTYNTLGQMTGMTRTINGQSYATGYTYDLAGEVLTTSYPSGRVVSHTRDAAARVTDVSLSGDISADILTDITYLPFGPIDGARFGDGHDLSLTYDSSYRATTFKRSKISTSIMDIDFEYDAAGDILALYDNLDNDRTQRFAYSNVSRLTRAEGVYGDIDYSYNLVGDRERRTRQRPSADGSMETVIEDYTYDPDTFRLTEVSVAGTVERLFDYTPSGQITRDNRAGQGGSDFTFENDARGRLVRVFENGTLAASYLYDEDDQRIAKTTSSGTTHYHYDLEGRLISETDGASGAAIREYLWLGLSPVAMIASSGVLPVGCDPDEAARIVALRDARQATLDTITAQVAVLTDTRATRLETRATVAARRDRLQGLLEVTNPTNTARIADLTARIARDDGRLADLDANIADLDERLAYYAERTDYLTGRVDALTRRADQLNAACEAANDNTQSAALYFLHTDHLGRPKVATDSDGNVVWDGGLTTPFGQGITTMGALTQKLMFPGQYADEETGYSHNWHRTYDPTLGRYLQADPIGLAGGLNRYAYVGGNPVSLVDPTGEVLFVPILIGIGAGAVIDAGFQYFENGRSFKCFDLKRLGISAGLGAFGGGGGALLKNGARKVGTEWSHAIAKRHVDKVFRPGSRMNRLMNKRGGLNGTWVSPERHARHDFWRRIAGKTLDDKLPIPLRALDRIPDYAKAGVLTPTVGQAGLGGDCEC